MSAVSVTVPGASIEPVDPPEVVRETVGVDRVLKLLVLYHKRLLRVVAEYRALPTEPNKGGLGNPLRPSTQGDPYRKQFRPLRPAVLNLARYASGLIENARISQIDKIELQLRLAELESALEIATDALAATPASSTR